MPEIIAKLGNVSRDGRNANERPLGDMTAPSQAITAKAPALAAEMNKLNNHGRSAYACAEAQALAKLLTALNPPIDYGAIEFSCPTSDDGLLLWVLCDNCLTWMTKKSGFGKNKIFKISDAMLLKLQPQTAQAFKFNAADFPQL